MNTTPSSLHETSTSAPSRERALVLGGGGSAGNAWLIGVIAGLADAGLDVTDADAGLDVTDADLMIGTSAGSTAAAQVTGASPAQLYADILSTPVPQRHTPVASNGSRGFVGSPDDQLRRMTEIIAASEDVVDMRRRQGAAALAKDATSDGSEHGRWRSTVAARLPGQEWPARAIRITAVDAHTGEPVVFDRESGVDLADAVAASCAGGFAYRIGDRRYIDGGYRRSSENADLAAGYGRVLVLSPLGGRTMLPLEWGMQLAVQVDELRAGGSRVETVLPDSASLEAFGDSMMDLSTRPAAARAGFEQGRALAPGLAAFWA